MLGRGPRPGVERSGTPGLLEYQGRARGVGDSRFIISEWRRWRYRTLRALDASYWSSTWGSAALHPRAGSPAEHLGWGARLYAIATLRG